MTLADPQLRSASADPAARTAFLVVDSASVPDGRLLAAVKHPGESLSPDEALAREAGAAVPVTFHAPVAVCVLRVGADFSLLGFKCLDAPHFRPREIVNQFWFGVTHYKARLVTFDGRGFALPLLELAAFRHGIQARDYYQARDRYRGPIDLSDWFTNFGACPLAGGLDALAALLGKPGTPAAGDAVRDLHRQGNLQAINDDCLCRALDTYFVFLRTRVLTGDLTAEQEAERVASAKALLRDKAADAPALNRYLAGWGETAAG